VKLEILIFPLKMGSELQGSASNSWPCFSERRQGVTSVGPKEILLDENVLFEHERVCLRAIPENL
jgi:hypothetical protein